MSQLAICYRVDVECNSTLIRIAECRVLIAHTACIIKSFVDTCDLKKFLFIVLLLVIFQEMKV